MLAHVLMGMGRIGLTADLATLEGSLTYLLITMQHQVLGALLFLALGDMHAADGTSCSLFYHCDNLLKGMSLSKCIRVFGSQCGAHCVPAEFLYFRHIPFPRCRHAYACTACSMIVRPSTTVLICQHWQQGFLGDCSERRASAMNTSHHITCMCNDHPLT